MTMAPPLLIAELPSPSSSFDDYSRWAVLCSCWVTSWNVHFCGGEQGSHRVAFNLSCDQGLETSLCFQVSLRISRCCAERGGRGSQNVGQGVSET